MELKQIKELMAAMGRTGTKKLILKKEGFEIEIERGESYRPNEAVLAALESEDFSSRNELGQRANMAFSRGKEFSSSFVSSNDEATHSAAQYITSPMVGTFYTSPTPDDPSFIKVGDRIEKETVVCIIEAMKVMNEVKAGVVGTVVEILVDNGNPVEFGSKLFRIS